MINRKIYFFLLFLPMITIHLFYIFFCQSTIHYYPWHLNFLTSKIEMMYNYDKLMFIVISVENNLFVGVILRLCNSLTLFRFILWCSSKAINKTPDYLDLNLVNATKLFSKCDIYHFHYGKLQGIFQPCLKQNAKYSLEMLYVLLLLLF